MTQACILANRAVIADLEQHCPRVDMADGCAWRDTRPMLDPREHAPEVLDMATQALDYAQACGLLVQHPQYGYLVRQQGAARGQACKTT